MLLESDSSWLTVAGPYPMLPRLSAPVSGVDCPCPWFHANSLCCPTANCLSAVQRQPLSSGSPVDCLSFASPSHFRIRRDFRSKNPLSGFAPKQTNESSALAAHPHSATTVLPVVNVALGMVTKGLVQELQENGNKRTSGDHLNYSIIVVSQNTEKSPADLRRLAVIQPPTRYHWQLLVWKTRKEVRWIDGLLRIYVYLRELTIK